MVLYLYVVVIFVLAQLPNVAFAFVIRQSQLQHHQYHPTCQKHNYRSNVRMLSFATNNLARSTKPRTTTTTSSSLRSSIIEGLLDEDTFDDYCMLDETLFKLRTQLPYLLTTPLTVEQAQQLYDTKVKLVGPKHETTRQTQTQSQDTTTPTTTEILSSGIDELVAISTTLVAATRAAETAQKALAGFQSSKIDDNDGDDNQVECQFIILVKEEKEKDATANETIVSAEKTPSSNNKNKTATILLPPTVDTSRIWVRWRARPTRISLSPPSPSSTSRNQNPNNQNIVKGLSEFQISPQGKVSTHKLMDVTLNGRTIIGVGETLATLRRAAQSIPSDFLEDSPFRAVFQDVRDALQQQALKESVGSKKKKTMDQVSSILVTTNSTLVEQNTLRASWTTQTQFVEEYPKKDDDDKYNSTTPITAMNNNTSTIPLPGSKAWQKYKLCHGQLWKFWNEGIPILSGSGLEEEENQDTTSSIPEKIMEDLLFQEDDNDLDRAESLFSSGAILMGVDGKTPLVKGGSNIAKVYRTLSSFRRASQGKWTVRTQYANWKDRTLTMEWIVTLGNNGNTRATTTIEGTDRFIFNSKGQVIRMEQLELVVGGNRIKDPEPLRNMLIALERGGLSAPVELMNDFWKRFGSSTTKEESSFESTSKQRTRRKRSRSRSTISGPPELQEDAAASVYNLMRCLHRDLSLVSSSSRRKKVVPGEPFLIEDLKLRGYMGEQILKGKTPYKQLVGVALTTLRGLQQTKSVYIESSSQQQSKTNPITIELTSQGNLRVTFILALRVNPVSMAGVAINNNDMDEDYDEDSDWNDDSENKSDSSSFLPPFRSGLPLNIELISEYKLNLDGKVKEHRLIETRINGQLTPDEVILRWIRNLVSSEPQNNKKKNRNDPFSPPFDIPDLISVARSFGLGGTTK